MVNLNMFSSSDKGKEKEIRMDPPPLYDHDDDTSDPIDVSDGESYNSGFGSGYSEAGLLEDTASMFDEDGAHGTGYSSVGSLDDRSSIFEEEFVHGASSNSNQSHRSTPAETSTRPKGPVRFSLKPARKDFARLRKVQSPGASTSQTSSKVLCVVRTIMPNSTTGGVHYIASPFRSATSNQPIMMDIARFPPVETRVLQSSKLHGISTSVREIRIKPTLRYVLANVLHI
jgi:hypothetical protein